MLSCIMTRTHGHEKYVRRVVRGLARKYDEKARFPVREWLKTLFCATPKHRTQFSWLTC